MLAALFALALTQPPKAILAAVGDLMLDRRVGRYVDRYGSGYALAKVNSAFRDADLVFANLECSLTKRDRVLRKRYVLRAPPKRVAALAFRRPTVLSLANNHSLDCGRSGLLDTEQTLDRAGISFCGTRSRGVWRPRVVTVNSIRIAFLGFSDFPEVVVGDEPDIAYFDELQARTAIAKAKAQADIVVVAVHWGAEGSVVPTSRQRLEASALALNGVDLILGSHPHVLQPVEWLDGRNGKRTCVAFSMGDFLFDTSKPNECQTGIFRFELGKGGVTRCEVLPATIVDARPVLASSLGPPFGSSRSLSSSHL